MIKIFLITSAFFILNIDQCSEKGPSKYRYKRELDQKCDTNNDCVIKGSYCRQSYEGDQSTCQCNEDRYVRKNGKCAFALPCHLDGTNDECPPQHNCTRDPEEPEDSKTDIGYCKFQPGKYDENGECQKGTWSTADGLDCIEIQFCKTDQDCYGKGIYQKCFKENGRRVCRCPEGTKLTKRSECHNDSTNDVQSVSTLKPMDNLTSEPISSNHSSPSPDITAQISQNVLVFVTIGAIVVIGCLFVFCVYSFVTRREQIYAWIARIRKSRFAQDSRPGEDIPLNDMQNRENPQNER